MMLTLATVKSSGLQLGCIFTTRGARSFAYDMPIGLFIEDRELDNRTFTKFYYKLCDNCQAWFMRNVILFILNPLFPV
jgi:hypothetical protein